MVLINTFLLKLIEKGFSVFIWSIGTLLAILFCVGFIIFVDLKNKFGRNRK